MPGGGASSAMGGYGQQAEEIGRGSKHFMLPSENSDFAQVVVDREGIPPV